MGTYFPMSEDQRDSGTMLYLRDPLPNSQTQTPVLPGNIMYMNFGASSGSYSDALASNSNCMDAQPIASDSNPSHRQVLLSFGGSRAVENMILGAPGQGLSLTLGTHGPSVMQISPMQYQNDHPDFSPMLGCNTLIDRGRDVSFENEDTFQGKQSRDGDYMISSGVGSSSDGANDGTTYGMGMPSIARAVPNSKYLKAAQELLDEVVNVKQAIKRKESGKESKEVEGESMDGAVATATDPSGKATANSTNELSVAEKHELQNKLTKLLSMLDEVDRRYRQYYHQMQIVVSSFDVLAGSGASKPYTALALQTISRHFRCLRDAINVQIQTVRKSLGEEDATFSNKGVGISRLRFVDQQLRQQRALQQLGMMQQHAWRPQRGLPETSVSILRAWLFEHFLHPYPKDSDKIMLARQTGLTRSQVSNWFINARVRLWKPMVEEMYKEETGDADMDSNSSSETIPKAAMNATTQAFEDKVDELQHSTTTSTGRILESRSDQMTNVELLNMMQAESQNNYRTAEMRDGQRQNPFPDGVIEPSTSNDRFMAAAYHMSEMERFANTGGVTLTLGLQQCEGGDPMAMVEGSHHGFIPLRDTDVYNATGTSDMGNEAAEFDGLDSSNRPHQFVSSLLPSFS